MMCGWCPNLKSLTEIQQQVAGAFGVYLPMFSVRWNVLIWFTMDRKCAAGKPLLPTICVRIRGREISVGSARFFRSPEGTFKTVLILDPRIAVFQKEAANRPLDSTGDERLR